MNANTIDKTQFYRIKQAVKQLEGQVTSEPGYLDNTNVFVRWWAWSGEGGIPAAKSVDQGGNPVSGATVPYKRIAGSAVLDLYYSDDSGNPVQFLWNGSPYTGTILNWSINAIPKRLMISVVSYNGHLYVDNSECPTA